MARKEHINMDGPPLDNMRLETFGRGLLGRRLYHTAGTTEFLFWKRAFVRSWELIGKSLPSSYQVNDRSHHAKLKKEFLTVLLEARVCRSKDRFLLVMLTGAFRVIVLLLGREFPLYCHRARRVSKIDFTTDRQLMYYRTEENIALLTHRCLQSRRPTSDFDPLDYQFEYYEWLGETGKERSSVSFIEWADEAMPGLSEKV